MILRQIFLATAIMAAVTASAQSTTNRPDVTVKGTNATRPVYSNVEQMPTPAFDIKKYLADNLHYPAEAKQKNVEGKVIVRFVVNADGTVADCEAIKGIGSGCDEEALSIVKGMPRWNPGKQNGKAVNTYYTLPVIFSLAN